MFELEVTQNTQTEGSKPNVDWDALNQHVVDAAGTASKARSIPMIISGIIDLGDQEREPYEEEFKGDDEARAKAIAENPNVTFREEGGKVIISKPLAPKQQVAITVDAPQVPVNKGQFFGNSEELPLRLLLNGEFTIDRTRVVGKPYSISEKKYDDGTWAFAKNNGLHKLADAAGILDENGYFKKERIGELLGKVVQVKFRVWMKPSRKDASKTFFTEEVALAGMVPEGVPVPDASEVNLYGINMNRPNDAEAVKVLRASIKNTQKRALNYEGSVLQSELEGTASDAKPADAPAEKAKPKAKPKAAPAPVDDVDSFDDDIPF